MRPREDPYQGRGRPRWASALGLCAAWAALAAALGLMGCDAVTKYRVLSFFFDGVPPPPGVAVPESERTARPKDDFIDPNSPLARAIRAGQGGVATQPAATQPALVLHDPYRKRQCNRCHSREASFEVPVSAAVCRKCHLSYYQLPSDDWVHGPVALGLCSLCHLSHESRYAGLLRQPQEELCFTCHDRERTLAPAYHAEAARGRQTCGQCHDPHSAGNRLLLVDSTTYVRRRAHAVDLPSPHAEWKKKDCSMCHSAELSNKLLGRSVVEGKCLSCHAKVRQAPAGQYLHKPIGEGKCIDCHTAHRSPRPHLIKFEAEKICLGCHKLAEIDKPAHPKVRRGECLLCHTGHTSPARHLLRPADVATRPASDEGGPASRPSGPGARP